MCLISFEDINNVLIHTNITLNGVFHIGAYECEELELYNRLGVNSEDVVWIDANSYKVKQAIERGIPNVYTAVITDTDDKDIEFNITNNIHSSSVLELGTHLQEHPEVVYVNKIQVKSITIDTFFKRNNIDASKYNFWNIDIQGAELMALKGSVDSIENVDVILVEVNENELYIDCALIGEIDTFLSQYKFKRIITAMTQYGWGDALYISFK
jgi:FkbM family methyltransferase